MVLFNLNSPQDDVYWLREMMEFLLEQVSMRTPSKGFCFQSVAMMACIDPDIEPRSASIDLPSMKSASVNAYFTSSMSVTATYEKSVSSSSSSSGSSWAHSALGCSYSPSPFVSSVDRLVGHARSSNVMRAQGCFDFRFSTASFISSRGCFRSPGGACRIRSIRLPP